MAGETESINVAQLRQRAQAEIQQIAIEDKETIIARQQALADLERYAKVSKSRSLPKPQFKPTTRSQRSSASPSRDDETSDPYSQKGPKLRSAQDVLDRIRWDPSMKIDHFIVGYLERFDGMMTMPASQWIRETTEEDFIPQHRIKWVKKTDDDGNEEIVWDRDARVDKMFGSGAG